MASYVSIPADSIKNACFEMGMVEKATKGGRFSPGEVYFEMPTAVNPNLVIKVYTSITVGGGCVRGAGNDAIRVCLVWREGEDEDLYASVGLHKPVRVHRVSSVASTLKRMKDRVRDCNRMAFELNDKRCPTCGCPAWPDSGRCRNRKCPSPAPAPVPAPAPRAAGASSRLNAAFGGEHSPMTQAMAARAARPVPVAASQVARSIEKEADKNRAEDPVLTTRDMPPELRGLF